MKERIKFLRKYLKLNQTEFAKKIDVAQSTISDIERGAKTTSDIIIKICSIFNISADWLLMGKGEMIPNNNEKNEDIFKILNQTEKDIVKDIIKRATERADQENKDIQKLGNL